MSGRAATALGEAFQHPRNDARGNGAHNTVRESNTMQRPPLTWPLMLTLAVCVLVFLGVAVQVHASAGIVMLFSLASHPLGWLALAAVAFALMSSSFTFIRVLRRRSTLAARLYLMGVYALSGPATVFAWYQNEAADPAGGLWLVFIAGLFFLLRPATPNQSRRATE